MLHLPLLWRYCPGGAGSDNPYVKFFAVKK